MRLSFYPIFKISHKILVIIAIAFPLYFMFCSHFFSYLYDSTSKHFYLEKIHFVKNPRFFCLYPNSQTVLPGLLCRAYYSLGLSICASLFCFHHSNISFWAEKSHHPSLAWVLHSHLMGMKSEALKGIPRSPRSVSPSFSDLPCYSTPPHWPLCCSLNFPGNFLYEAFAYLDVNSACSSNDLSYLNKPQ